MGFRAATAEDVPAIAAFLRDHADQAMYPLSNLLSDGLGRETALQMRFWLRENDGNITGALGLSGQGFLLPMMPDADDKDWRGVLCGLGGETVIGIIGETHQARACISMAGLDRAAKFLDDDEPGFALDLARLNVPTRAGARLKAPDQSDRAQLIGWRADYHAEVLGTSPDQAQALAEKDIDLYLDRDSHRILLQDGSPVAMTGFTAALPDIVQIGGVYTPPALRGRGHARCALALHLVEARRHGAERAVLFAANEPAVRAYRALGFLPAGSMSAIIFAEPQAIRT